MLSHMVRFHFFLWMSNSIVYKYLIFFIPHLLMGTCVASISGLLYIMLEGTQRCIHLFELGFWISSAKCPEVGLLGHIVVLCFNFLRTLHTIFFSDCTN